MRASRASIVIMATVLAPTLLFSAPAVAAERSPDATGQAASTLADEEPSAEEDRIAILRILADEDTGRAVREAAQAALDGTPEDMRHFLEVGFYEARAEDDRVAVMRIIAEAEPGSALYEAAQEAMDGTDEDRRYFLEVGQYEVGTGDAATA
ncbi:ALF repeat-containing protein [Streptomyces sp. TR06-5]|uniref:ALF repeat-containing protein n=1 Tax=unclassified Streptomyces TaxID=2593676 RepID=UPI0039A3298C